MAIALVTTATQVSVAGSSTTAPSITISATNGNAITGLASIWDNNATWTLTNTTDGGNSFTTRQGSASGSSRSIAAVAWAVNITGGSRTVAFNLAGSSAGTRSYELGCLEFSGVKTSAAEDAQDANAEINAGTTDASAGPITTTDAGDLLIGAATDNSGDLTLNFASPTSWTNKYRQNDSNGTIGFDAGYWLPGATQTTYTAQWAHDNTAGDVAAGVVVALLAAVGGTQNAIAWITA